MHNAIREHARLHYLDIMLIVNTLLQDVAEDPNRLNKAMELAAKQIKETFRL